MFRKKKLSDLDVACETTAYLETLSDDELLRRARERNLEKFRAKYGQYADERFMVCEGIEMDIYNARREKRREAERSREVKVSGFWNVVRRIVFSPISSALNLVSFVCDIVAKISFLGLIAGAYYLYQSFSAMAKGVPFADIDTFSKAIPFIIFPFIAYAVAELLNRAYLWTKKMSK